MLRPLILISTLILALSAPITPAHAGTDEVRYLGTYWGQSNIREEVAPGDSGVRLTVALASDFEEDSITGLKATLSLPPVMRSQSLSTPREVESHFPGIIPPGGVFEITFIANIEESAEVGKDYDATLLLEYRVVGGSLRLQSIPIKINVPGRPVLKFSLNSTVVEPGRVNSVELWLTNVGTVKATDIRVLIQPPQQPSYGLILTEQPWVVEELPPNKSVKLVVGVYASQVAGDSVMPLTVSARYRNAVGSYSDITSVLSMYFKKPAVSDAYVRIYSEPLKMEPGSIEPMSFIIENTGPVLVSEVRVNAEPAGLPVSLIGQSSWSVGSLKPGERVTIAALVSTAQAAANGVYQIPLRVSFKDTADNSLTTVATITVAVGDIPPKAPNLLIESEPSIVAGQTQTVRLTIKNIHSSELKRVSVTVQSLNPRLTIVGSNNWLVDSLSPGQTWEFLMRLYAEPEVAGTSAAISVSATYIISDRGEQASERRDVGYVVEGYITLRIYDVRVIFVGGEPYISGNILNEGISDALFATISLNSGSGTKASTFIGEIKPNAPLPFNLKINSQDERFRGSIVVEYKDVFRSNYSSVFQVDLEIPRPVSEAQQESGPWWIFPAMLVAGSVAVLIGVYAYAGRRKRRESD